MTFNPSLMIAAADMVAMLLIFLSSHRSYVIVVFVIELETRYYSSNAGRGV